MEKGMIVLGALTWVCCGVAGILFLMMIYDSCRKSEEDNDEE